MTTTKRRKPVPLSELHVEILRYMAKRRMRSVTPDEIAREWNPDTAKSRVHGFQQWAYLQLARMRAKGLTKVTARGHYQITAKGLGKAKRAA